MYLCTIVESTLTVNFYQKELEIHSIWIHFHDEGLIKATPDFQLL